jgi:hypothetical protein
VILGCTHRETFDERQRAVQVERQREEIHQRWEREKREAQEAQEAQQRRVQEQIEAQQREVAQQQQTQIAIEQQVAHIRGSTLPKNHKVQIDTSFVRTLKDPDSRKITYTGNPYGSLVCGTINARNSYGGYTGPQPFYAYFAPNGQLAELQSDFSLIKHLIEELWKLYMTEWETERLASIRYSTKFVTAGVTSREEMQAQIKEMSQARSKIEQQVGGLSYKLLHDCGFQIP